MFGRVETRKNHALKNIALWDTIGVVRPLTQSEGGWDSNDASKGNSLKRRKRTWFVFRKQNGNLVLKG